MKALVTFSTLSLLLLGCRHADPKYNAAVSPGLELSPEKAEVLPEKRSTAAEIRQYIVGVWMDEDESDNSWFECPKIIFQQDGKLIGVRDNDQRVSIGTWEIYVGRPYDFAPQAENEKPGGILVVRRAPLRLKDVRASESDPKVREIRSWDYYPLIYADAHHLVISPGFSVAGRMRFKR